MERNYSNRRISTYLLSLFVLVLGSSCTIYQNVPDDDGIYSTSEKKEPRVIVENSDEHKDYEKNYFSKELEKIDQINGTDIITDVENYSSYNDTIPDTTNEIEDTTINTNKDWGYNDNDDVVVHINVINDFYPYWGFGFNRWNRWNRWDYWDPYYGYSWYCPPFIGWGFNPYWGYRPYRNWTHNWRYSAYGGRRFYGRRAFYGRSFFGPRGTGGFGSYAYYRWRRTSVGSRYNTGPYNGIYNPLATNNFSRRNSSTTRRSNSVNTRTRRSSDVYRTRTGVTRSNSTNTRSTNTRSANTRTRTRITGSNSNGGRRTINTRSRNNSRSNANRSRSSSRNRSSSVNRNSSRNRSSSANRSSSRSRSSANRSSSSRSRSSSSRSSSSRRKG
ncbi:hypothetical protein AAON49_13330 [Pseudotenacibaculum sp. MALMAid0570]|uniref:hypothetical protein n=1 Tax=Pseudotenacibaculum sp. MALMAid0570 TaxID=3143938 RepID=UPI0032DFE50E